MTRIMLRYHGRFPIRCAEQKLERWMREKLTWLTRADVPTSLVATVMLKWIDIGEGGKNVSPKACCLIFVLVITSARALNMNVQTNEAEKLAYVNL